MVATPQWLPLVVAYPSKSQTEPVKLTNSTPSCSCLMPRQDGGGSLYSKRLARPFLRRSITYSLLSLLTRSVAIFIGQCRGYHDNAYGGGETLWIVSTTSSRGAGGGSKILNFSELNHIMDFMLTYRAMQKTGQNEGESVCGTANANRVRPIISPPWLASWFLGVASHRLPSMHFRRRTEKSVSQCNATPVSSANKYSAALKDNVMQLANVKPPAGRHGRLRSRDHATHGKCLH
ncbi:hypothetical protein ZHAS_00013202 [Anopheles sinensis]|uniref:Uncharacterized protein n=1 Tax=Anopheles sinensis TaxID=74873 RepID=A0A084W4W3_ANOSI|nr:hypothetical protein ZHAS_00013202 [Anopheles sinensis]